MNQAEKSLKMAKITLNLLNLFALRIGKSSVEYESNMVGDIILQFLNEYKDNLEDGLMSHKKRKMHKDILILVNGRNITYLNKYKTELKEGDEVYISIALAGG